MATESAPIVEARGEEMAMEKSDCLSASAVSLSSDESGSLHGGSGTGGSGVQQQSSAKGTSNIPKPLAKVRENRAARGRIKKSHTLDITTTQTSPSGGTSEQDPYLTPLQKKENTIKELRQQLKQTQKSTEDMEMQFARYEDQKKVELDQLQQECDKELDELKAELAALGKKCDDLTMSYEQSVKTISALEKTVEDLDNEMQARERKHEKMYFEMYKKGQESARFERQNELERLARDDPEGVSIQELLEKLESTNIELEHWQSLKRQEVYDSGAGLKPETEAEATLRFLKDSMFHYLTNPKAEDEHLRAMIEIFRFSEVQLKALEKALRDKKKKSVMQNSHHATSTAGKTK